MSWEEVAIPNVLPNPYALTINGQVYDGSEEVTVTTSSSELTYTKYTYTDTSLGTDASTGINPNTVYVPNSSSTSTNDLTIYVNASKFSKQNSIAIVVVKGTRTVTFTLPSSGLAGGRLIKQNNILTTGTDSDSYRVYCFYYIGFMGLSLNSRTVAVNCAEYSV
jgi:hypothetical protein